jgi:methylenetetrahydrofolate dehydrogenase (NADP+)/methenyltetrahydrofolate cyclohydrolase
MAEIIDGKKIADKVLSEVAAEAANLQPKPCLAIILVGDNPASQTYVRKKTEACAKAGIISRNIALPAKTTQKKLMSQIKKLNRDKAVHAILVQMPLPPQISGADALLSILPQKDVDGLHPLNAGMLHSGTPKIISCTPLGIMRLLSESGVKIEGANAVVIGRSSLVGKPIAELLLQKNATVTICHSKTADIAAHTRKADIIIAAAGSPKMLKREMVKPGAVVIDVGTTKVGERLVGDVDFDAVKEIASKITPVPGGVGPMTVAMLLRNTLQCYKLCTMEPQAPEILASASKGSTEDPSL